MRAPVDCPRCGSWKWFKKGEVSSGEYSFKKGILGAVVLGPVGAVAGMNGKKKSVYCCEKCGFSSEYDD